MKSSDWNALLLQRYNATTRKLRSLYEDEDKNREKELRAIAGPNEFAEFYSRFKSLKDAHRRNPDEVGGLFLCWNYCFADLII